MATARLGGMVCAALSLSVSTLGDRRDIAPLQANQGGNPDHQHYCDLVPYSCSLAESTGKQDRGEAGTTIAQLGDWRTESSNPQTGIQRACTTKCDSFF